MIGISEINKLLIICDIDNAEKELIYAFVRRNELDYKQSPILKSYFNGFVSNISASEYCDSLYLKNIKTLEKYLELLIPIEDRKLNGAFFTPDFIISYIIDTLQPKLNDKNLDPSCGCGAFLVGLVEYYRNTFGKPIKNILKENIFGADILQYNVRRAKLLLALYALQNGEKITDNDLNVFEADSLRKKWTTKFDNILGNPPYVKFQDLSDVNRDYLKNYSSVEGGTFNLYFAFFELGYKLLATDGKLGYITPNNYFTSLAGEALRRFFMETGSVYKIIDFSHRKVFDAQTYTAITFLSKTKNSVIEFDRVEDGQEPSEFLKSTQPSPNHIDTLNVKKWRLLKEEEHQAIHSIENIGTPIGKLFDINVGIATLKDELFFLDSGQIEGAYYLKNIKGQTFKIENEIVRTVYKISDFVNQDAIRNNSRKIITPYQIKNGIATVIPEEVMRTHYPYAYAYFNHVKNELGARDKGKTSIYPFYAWGRTQGLTKTGVKLLTPTFSQKPRFLIPEDGNSYFTNGYGIFYKKDKVNTLLFQDEMNLIQLPENLDVLQKILNSEVMNYYVRKTSVSIEGGYPCYQKNFIEKFTIPFLSESDILTLRSISTIDVDSFLCELYHLNIPLPNLVL